MSQSGSSQRWFFALLILIFITIIGIASWNGSASGPTAAALESLNSDSAVTITIHDDVISFESADPTAKTGLIFYPGGKVDYRAYAPVLRKIAEQGFSVYVPSMPLYLAIMDSNAADDIIAAHPDIEHWFIAGHSLGGVAASSYAANNPSMDGIVFWASYPASDALKNTSLPVLSIFGTLDGLSSPAEVEASRANLPTSAVFVAIEGGNHAQFGAYGPQDGDNPATISAEEQTIQIARATVSFMNTLGQ